MAQRAWHVAGSYFESCNCEAICPCRLVGERVGGRSTYGECFGALAWLIERGSVDDLELEGLGVVLVYRYDDDEAGSPWRLVLHVDERAGPERHEALKGIFLGELGGDGILALPWVRKPIEAVTVRSSPVQITHGEAGHDVRVGEAVALSAHRPVETDDRVSCIVPGHDRAGTELYADELLVHDDGFEWELWGNCAFVADFDYASDAA